MTSNELAAKFTLANRGKNAYAVLCASALLLAGISYVVFPYWFINQPGDIDP